ncbi:MAG: DUF3307 domain-containing protein [Bacillota bacterium]
MELFWLLVLAHLGADFLLQTAQIAADKRTGRRQGYIKHAAGHFLSLVFFTHYYISPAMILLWVVLPAAHTLIDWLKNRLNPPGHPAGAPVFLLDQALHFLIIFCVWQWTATAPCEWIINFYSNLLSPAGSELCGTLFKDTALPTLLITAAIYGYVLLGGSVLVRKVLDLETLRLPDQQRNYDNTRLAGRYIGLLERALILTLTLAGAFTAIAFVFTAKSIARYRELENRDFAEYYLVGTLLSTLLAFSGGLLLRFIR